jgi:hypothetical protein
MGYIQADSTLDARTIPTKIRDELIALTGWSIRDQGFANADGTASGSDPGEQTQFHDLKSLNGADNYTVDVDGDGQPEAEFITLSTPTGEFLSILPDYEDTGMRFSYGDTVSTRDGAGETTDDFASHNGYINPTDGYPDENEVTMTDAVTFWLSYDSEGFCLYITRDESDGYDHHCAYGWSKLNRVWDYPNAANKEGKACFLLHGGGGDQNTPKYWSGTPVGGDYYQPGGKGLLNPDTNSDAYVTHDTVTVESSKYQNAEGTKTPIGTHSRWVKDESGSDTAHADIIQDSSANNEFIILKEYYGSTEYSDFALAMRIL